MSNLHYSTDIECNFLTNVCTVPQIKLLKESLSVSHKEGHHLRSRLAKMQMDSLPPLKLLPRQPQKIQEGKDTSNQTDQEKSVEREISSLQRVSYFNYECTYVYV